MNGNETGSTASGDSSDTGHRTGLVRRGSGAEILYACGVPTSVNVGGGTLSESRTIADTGVSVRRSDLGVEMGERYTTRRSGCAGGRERGRENGNGRAE